MRKKNPFISVTLAFTFLFISATQVSAQEVIAYGEIKSSGDVMIASSTDKWTKMKGIYPLLNSTEIMTKEGVAFIVMKDGSKIELSKNTEASIDVKKSYLANLKRGTLYFGVIPSDSLSIFTAQATILVAKETGSPDSQSIQGMVISSEKGTEIRCFSGHINVTFLGSQKKILKTDEIFFVSSSGPVQLYATGAKARLINSTFLGLFITGGTVAAFDAFRKGGIASPSIPF